MTDLSQVNERRKTSVSLFMPTGRRGFNKYGLHKRSVKKCIELLNWNIACTYVRTFFSTKKILSGVFLRSFSSLEYFNKKKSKGHFYKHNRRLTWDRDSEKKGIRRRVGVGEKHCFFIQWACCVYLLSLFISVGACSCVSIYHVLFSLSIFKTKKVCMQKRTKNDELDEQKEKNAFLFFIRQCLHFYFFCAFKVNKNVKLRRRKYNS